MNTLPSELIAVPGYHGYFWHPTEKILYSIKVDGVLKPLKFNPSYSNNRLGVHVEAGFAVSRKGRRKRLTLFELKKLIPHNYQVPYQHEIRSRI